MLLLPRSDGRQDELAIFLILAVVIDGKRSLSLPSNFP